MSRAPGAKGRGKSSGASQEPPELDPEHLLADAITVRADELIDEHGYKYNKAHEIASTEIYAEWFGDHRERKKQEHSDFHLVRYLEEAEKEAGGDYETSLQKFLQPKKRKRNPVSSSVVAARLLC